MTIKEPEKFENYILNEINDILDIRIVPEMTISEMTYLERCFLNGIVRQNKPKKILEVGVSAGGSSAVILNAIKDFDNAKLYSVDYNKKWYRDNSEDTGFIIDEKFSYLKNKWKLYTGGTAAKFMEEIGGEIDLCLIDTMHINPGEFLDFLIVLPYLKKNAILILHDISLHSAHRQSITNGILFSCLRGEKFSFNAGIWGKFANIGAVILDENIKDNILDYMFLLTLPWIYSPEAKDILECKNLFSKHYGEELAETFMSIMFHNQQAFIKDGALVSNVENERLFKLDRKIIKLIDSIAWWIPIRKWRDSFRNKILNI